VRGEDALKGSEGPEDQNHAVRVLIGSRLWTFTGRQGEEEAGAPGEEEGVPETSGRGDAEHQGPAPQGGGGQGDPGPDRGGSAG